MEARLAASIRERLASRHVPAAPGGGLRASGERLLFTLGQAPRLLGTGEVRFALGCTGELPPPVTQLRFEPAALEGLFEWAVEVIEAPAAAGWQRLAFTLTVRPEVRREPARLEAALAGRRDFELGFVAPGADNLADFRVRVAVQRVGLRASPAALDFGELAPLGLHQLELPTGPCELIGRGRRWSLRGPARPWLTLDDGLYQLRSEEGARPLRLDRYRRALELANDGDQTLELELIGAPRGVRVTPAVLQLRPGERRQLAVRLDPRQAPLAGGRREGELVLAMAALDGGGRHQAGALRVPVGADWRAPVVALALSATRLAPEPWAASDDATLRLPLLMMGEGRVPLTVTALDEDGERVDELIPPFSEALTAGGAAGRAGELELPCRLGALLGDPRRRFVLQLESDQPARDLRLQRLPVALSIEGVTLASRKVEVSAHAGLRYAIPLAFFRSGAGAPRVAEAAAGLTIAAIRCEGSQDAAELESRLRPISGDELPWAATNEQQTSPGAPGARLEIEPALELDLGGLTMPGPHRLAVELELRDPQRGVRFPLSLALDLRPQGEVLRAALLAGEPRRLELILVNPLRQPVTLTTVRLSGDPLPRFAPSEHPIGQRLDAGATWSAELPVDLPRGTGMIRRLVSGGQALRIQLLTDVPGVRFELRCSIS